MRHHLLFLGVGLFVTLALSSRPAHGQPPGNAYYPSRQPAVSPYINLLRSGNNPAINYYGIVRPEIALRNNLLQLQGQQAATTTQQQDLAAALTLPPTGHVSGFQTQSRYFMTKGGQGTVGQPVAPLKGAAPGGKKGGVQR